MIPLNSLEEVFHAVVGSETKVGVWLSDLSARLGSKTEEVVDALDRYRSQPAAQRSYVVHKTGFHACDDYQLEIEKKPDCTAR